MPENQTEKEFFAVVETGRKGVEQMLSSRAGEDIRELAAPNVSAQFDTWAKRALVHVMSRDELKPVIATRAGIYSVYQELAKAAQMGLQVGGQFPHAYLVPMGGKAKLVVTAEGLAFCAAHGPGAVLKSIPPVVEVYEADTFKVDQAGGKYVHEYDPRSNRGKLCGFFARLEYRDGRVEIPYVSMETVEQIERAYGNTNSPAYKKSPHDMHRKTAAKKIFKKAAAESEGLAMLLDADADAYAPEPVERPADVRERVVGRLADAADALEPPGEPEGEVVEGKVVEEEAPEPEAPAPEAGKKPAVELF